MSLIPYAGGKVVKKVRNQFEFCFCVNQQKIAVKNLNLREVLKSVQSPTTLIYTPDGPPTAKSGLEEVPLRARIQIDPAIPSISL